MIPLQLTLKNFLSYRETTLDFRGLHTACICGANGAGKSSLLEAITWVVWGKTRAASEDDVIHGGAKSVRVDFDFICNYQTYRIIRSRSRGRSGSLDFQVATESGGFRSLTAKGLKATQQDIISCIKLDYDTFINSAYLRQGRADEFMLRRPNERKQILADLLKLERYEELATKAKDLAKEYKIKVEQLEQSLNPLQSEIEQRQATAVELKALEKQLTELQTVQEQEREKLTKLQAVEHQRQAWEQQYTWQQSQHQNLVQDCDRLKKEIIVLESQERELSALLAQESEIVKDYEQLLSLQQAEQDFARKFSLYQQAQQQKQTLEQQLLKQKNELSLEIKQTQTRLENIQQQEQEIQNITADADKVATALAELEKSRNRLKELDKLQQYISPLLKQKQNLETEIAKTKANFTAKLDQLQLLVSQLENQIAQVPQMREEKSTVDNQLEDLDKKRNYQKRVKEKGEERRAFQNSLITNQKLHEQQWQELQQKIDILIIPDATCPLCEQELDHNHRHQVTEKTREEQLEIEQQIWIIKEQLVVCDREIEVLIKEYKQLDKELASYDSLIQKKGHLEAQLEAKEDTYEQLDEIITEKEALEKSLSSGDYAFQLQINLQQLEQELQQLSYDEQTHALIRGETERWRWAEIKQAKIEDAVKREAKLKEQKPELLTKISALEQAIARLSIDSPIKQQILAVEQEITELGYEQSQHQNLLEALRQAQNYHLKYQQFQQAQTIYPQIQSKQQELSELLKTKIQATNNSQEQLENYINQVSQIDDYRSEIQQLEREIYQRRQQLDELISRSGRLKESIAQIENLKVQYQQTNHQLKETKRKYLIYQELAQAFGKNGIQALTIENILPQLEAETNQILSRLTANQFHVQFLTQKASKSNSKKNTKLIDTLDILISDTQGTRSYETYSGGEAFRINFSIRLALAKLLAQRSGTALQMLIVDEGFGTQDGEGCDRLVAAINAIASDFACILAVTHMPQFKEAFQTRIEVYKGERGSLLRVNS